MIIRQEKQSTYSNLFRKRKNNLEFLITKDDDIRFLFIHLRIKCNNLW